MLLRIKVEKFFVLSHSFISLFLFFLLPDYWVKLVFNSLQEIYGFFRDHITSTLPMNVFQRVLKKRRLLCLISDRQHILLDQPIYFIRMPKMERYFCTSVFHFGPGFFFFFVWSCTKTKITCI